MYKKNKNKNKNKGLYRNIVGTHRKIIRERTATQPIVAIKVDKKVEHRI